MKKENIKMMNRLTIYIYVLFLSTFFVYGQENTGKLQWSATKKITVDDFYIKTRAKESIASFAQFSIEYQVNGLNFLTKNFNKKVQNYMIKPASWIDTATNVNRSLLYQQTLFDIAEIYTRKFRKALRDNRKKLIQGTQIVAELNNKIMTDFAKRRVDYDMGTKFGEDSIIQKEWESQIQKELSELGDFAYEK
jgi:hypothetical protein